MKVIAIKLGYFDGLRQEGDTFDVPQGMTASWFVPADEQDEAKEAPAAAKVKGKKADNHTASDLV